MHKWHQCGMKFVSWERNIFLGLCKHRSICVTEQMQKVKEIAK